MNSSFFRLLFLLFGLVCIPTLLVQAEESHDLPSIDINPPFILVEDLSANIHTASNSITITGKVKNVSHSIIRGYATFYLLSLEGEELYSFEEEVNSGKGFAHGVTIEFEATATVADLKKIGSISLDFTQK